MGQTEVSTPVAGRLVAYGSAIGAAIGLVVTGILAVWALTSDPPVEGVLAVLTVVIGTVAGASVGLASAGVAALVHAHLRARLAPAPLTLSTAAGSALGACGLWLVVSRLSESLQPLWIFVAVGLVAALVAALTVPRIARHPGVLPRRTT